VGTLDAVVTNESGERFRLLMTHLAHEVMTPTSFSSTAPIHAFIVAEEGRVRDYAALTGRVNIDRTTGEAVHKVVDSGTCHQRANVGPGADQAVVSARSSCCRSTRRSSWADGAGEPAAATRRSRRAAGQLIITHE
jgi:hypothetical protein